ncbi:FecR family protein [Rubrolithibacter danxiaensis]|uniref:FecR family protein n=1 Tax=Rubrolithibacter danxiaensis TaxID=3390805 RepID=UPI003BF85647
MTDYNNFEAEDFLSDDFFLDWVINNSREKDVFWHSWISQNPDKAIVVQQAIDIIRSVHINPVGELSQAEIDAMVERLRERQFLKKEVRPLFYRSSWLRIAAVLLLASVAGLVYFKREQKVGSNANKSNSLTQSDILIKKINSASYPMLVKLSDKSSVVLQPGSEIMYPGVFTASKREVFLTGEALFEVSKDAKRPFLVHSGDMVTRVLGTSFTVNAKKGAKQFEVIVNTGKVSVYYEKPASASDNKKRPLSEVLLTPNEKVVYLRTEERLVKTHLPKPLELSKEVSKTSFNFNETPFSDIVKAISRAYSVTIIYNEKNLANCPLTATLADQSLDEKLDLICRAVEAHYSINNGKVIIDGKGCTTTTTN